MFARIGRWRDWGQWMAVGQGQQQLSVLWLFINRYRGAQLAGAASLLQKQGYRWAGTVSDLSLIRAPVYFSNAIA